MKNNLLFCENCNELTENDVCPKCGAPTRAPQNDDMCFVQELSGINADMYADALSNNDIEFVHMPSFSVNVTSAPALQGVNYYNTPSSYKFYVHFADFDQAWDTLNAIFGNNAETDYNDDPASAIDRLVKVIVDRPLGSVHPEHPDIKYGLNYGYVEGVMGGDGEEEDAYIIGVNASLSRMSTFDGYVIAVIVRKNDVETKWVVAPIYAGDARYAPKYTKEQIASAVNFQEKFFDIEIIM